MLMSSSAGKRKAAEAALAEVKDGQVLGLGTGSTVLIFLELLSERIRKEGIEVIGVPTSYGTALAASSKGIKLTTLDEHPQLDLAVDGADEIDPSLNLIKGGGAALTREKVVDSSAKRFIVIADSSKLVKRLGNFPLPIEVLPFARAKVMGAVAAMGGQPKLRDGGDRKDGPLVTDNGNFIIDASFGEIADPERLERELKMVPGVVEVGLFVGMANRAYVGNASGAVTLERR